MRILQAFQSASHQFAIWAGLITFFLLPWMKLNLTEVFLWLTLVAIFCSGNFSEKKAILLVNPYIKWLVALLALYFVSITYSYAGFATAFHTAQKNLKFLYPLLLVPFFTLSHLKEKMMTAFLIGILISFFLSLSCFVFPAFYEQFFARFSNTPEYPLINHIFGSLMDAFGAFYCLHELPKSTFKKRCFLSLIVIFSLGHILFLSTSRTGIFLFLILGGLFLIQKKQWKLLFMGNLLAILFLGIAFKLNLSQNIQHLSNDIVEYQKGNYNTSIGYRLKELEAGFILWKKKPVWGFGSGAVYRAYYEEGRKQQPSWVDTSFQPLTPDSNVVQTQYVKLGVELGIVGLFLFFAWVFSAIRFSQHLVDKQRWTVQALILMLILGNFDDQMLYSALPGMFFILMTSLFLANPAKKEQDSQMSTTQ